MVVADEAGSASMAGAPRRRARNAAAGSNLRGGLPWTADKRPGSAIRDSKTTRSAMRIRNCARGPTICQGWADNRNSNSRVGRLLHTLIFGGAEPHEHAAMLDFVHPIRTGWWLGSTGRDAGVDEAVGADNEHFSQIAARHRPVKTPAPGLCVRGWGRREDRSVREGHPPPRQNREHAPRTGSRYIKTLRSPYPTRSAEISSTG
jgi:hypothetical protein